VPCCNSCNKSFEEDQEYMQLVLLARHVMEGHPAAAELIAKAGRGFKHHRGGGPAPSVLATIHTLFRHTPQGTVETGAFIPELDRIERVCALVTRGLFFEETGRVLPSGYCVVARFIDGTREKAEVRDFLESATALIGVGTGRVFGDYFEYKFITPDDDRNSSAWLLTFYKHNRAICVTNPAHEFHSDVRRY
jgi:hypothetical protein